MPVFSQFFRRIQRATTGQAGVKVAAVATLLIGASSASHAQKYVGNAYGLDTSVAGILGIKTCEAVLPDSGSAAPIKTDVANASVGVSTASLLSGNATTDVINASTIGSNGTIDSKSVVNNLAIPISGLETLYAATLVSETTASFSNFNAVGSSNITGLYYTDTLGNRVNLTANGSANQVIASIPGIVSITLNEQLWNAAHDTLTTNAIDVQTVLGSHVIVSSSTAGFSGTASAPEPGSLALLGSLALPGFAGATRLRRLRYRATNHSGAV